ncbi:hypothetical protein [Vibrio sp. M260118]|uniref:hypothetical protein n=1 Tax=Vibrio sp. M260118 TaxID=3020896 RepID=UPI002F3EC922
MQKTLATVIASILLLFSQSVLALSAPTGEPILWVSGNIAESNSDQGVEFDQAMIDQLQQVTVQTNNHVVEQTVEYKGPTISSILELVKSRGESVRIIAWDDYVVTVPVSDLDKYQVLLATHEAGKRLTIDDKGPFFVVFPFADHAELRNDFYYSLSVWQVREIVVE